MNIEVQDFYDWLSANMFGIFWASPPTLLTLPIMLAGTFIHPSGEADASLVLRFIIDFRRTDAFTSWVVVVLWLALADTHRFLLM
jgi:hypothetical protein